MRCGYCGICAEVRFPIPKLSGEADSRIGIRDARRPAELCMRNTSRNNPCLPRIRAEIRALVR